MDTFSKFSTANTTGSMAKSLQMVTIETVKHAIHI